MGGVPEELRAARSEEGAATVSGPFFAARLDRIPFFRFHIRLLAIGGLAYVFDAMDVAVVAFVLPVLKTQWHLSDTHVGFLAAGASIGGIAGASLGGWLGDIVGRRSVMIWALAVYSVATFASAWTSSWEAFFLWRVVAGVGTSAESAIVAPFLSEFAAPAFRGRYIGVLVSLFSVGFLTAAALSYVVIPLEPTAWRYALVITALPIGMLPWWRRSLPESPRWLASNGRAEEAERVTARIEDEYRGRHGPLSSPVLPRTGSATALPQAAFPVMVISRLFSRPLARAMSMALLAWFSIGYAYYAFFTWMPSMLVARGSDLNGSYAFAIVIYAAQIPGYLTAAMLNDFIGRRAVTAGYMLLGALSAGCLAAATGDPAVLAGACCMSFFMNGTYAGIYAYTPELFPTEARATAHGLALACSRIAAAISPIAVGYVYPKLGFVGVFGVSSAILACGALAVIVLGVATHNISLERISKS